MALGAEWRAQPSRRRAGRAARAVVVRLRPQFAGLRRAARRRTTAGAAHRAPGQGGGPSASWPQGACPSSTTGTCTAPPSCSILGASWWPGTARRISTRPRSSRPSSPPATGSVRGPGHRAVGLIVGFDGDFPEVARAHSSARGPSGPGSLRLRGGGLAGLGPAAPGRGPHQRAVVGAGQPGRFARNVDPARAESDHRPSRTTLAEQQAPCRAGPPRPSSSCTGSISTWPTSEKARARSSRTSAARSFTPSSERASRPPPGSTRGAALGRSNPGRPRPTPCIAGRVGRDVSCWANAPQWRRSSGRRPGRGLADGCGDGPPRSRRRHAGGATLPTVTP